MPDASGNFKGVSLGGKAGETLDRIFGEIKITTPEIWEIDSEGIGVNEDGTLRFTAPCHYITRLEAEKKYGL